jgi:PAS domain S-box-containing protein
VREPPCDFARVMLKLTPKVAWLAWVVLGIGLLVSVFAGLQVKQGIEHHVQGEFAFACDQVTLKIEERLDAFALVLRGGAALFAASKEVKRNEWHAFAANLKAEKGIPGAQGIGFAQIIPADQLATHIAQIRAEGFPGYTVHPPGQRDLYTSIIYLEPFRDRNLRAFGYDMYAEPVRRAAMEQARDTGEAALSGKVELVQENGIDIQAGTLMYMPVYRNGMAVDTVAQRRSAILGWVYSPYRMNNLMSGILGEWESHEGKIVDLQIYDIGEANPANLLFDNKQACTPDKRSLFYQQRTVDFNGNRWLLVFDRTPSAPAIVYTQAWVTLAGGILVSGLLSWLMSSIINTRRDAFRIATHLTEAIRNREEALQESDAKIHLLLDSTAEAIYGIDVGGGCTFCNNACLRLLGYQHPDELLGKNMHWLIHGKYADGTFYPLEACRIFRACNSGERMHVDDEVLWRADGTSFPAEYWSYPQIRDGVVVGAVVTFLDITERRRARSELEQVSARLELALRAGGIGVWEYVIVNDTLVWDDRMFALYGINRMDFTNAYDAWRTGIHPDDSERENAEFQMAIRGEKEFDSEFRVCWPDGSLHHIRALAVAQRDNAGKPERMIGTSWDITEIRQREKKKLDDSENRYRSIFEGSPDGIVIADVEHKKILFANPAACKMLGYSDEEFKMMNVAELHPEETLHRTLAAFEMQADGKIRLAQNIQCIKKDGSSLFADINSSRVVINGRKHLVGFFRDITDRKQTEEKLARREAEMRTTLYSIGDGVISLDINGRVTLMNQVAEQLTGWSESEALGKPLEEVFCIINEETREKIVNPVSLISNVVDNMGIVAHNLLIARDGTEYSIGDSAAPIFDQGNNITGFVLVFRDLTKERESANTIFQQFAIIETYVGLVALADMDGKLIYINKGGTKMLGATDPSELLTKDITDFIVPANFSRKTDKITVIDLKDERWSGESTLKRIDASSIPVSQTIFPIRDDEDKPKHIGIIMMDISPQKELQEKLQMSEKLAVMGRLMADVSHELNNPLAIVIGRTEFMLSHIDEQSEPFKAKLEIVLHSARRCKTILSNLLTYSRTIGKKEGAVNLPDLIAEAINSVNYECDMTAVDVTVNSTLPPDTAISGNKDALLSVFINLIRNAWRAMAKKGSLSFILAQENENYLRIEIQDTGVGISSGKLKNIFQPFSSGWREGDGTGLGLATSRGIIETHGGIIWVESEGEGKGAKFTVLLPYKIRHLSVADLNQ